MNHEANDQNQPPNYDDATKITETNNQSYQPAPSSTNVNMQPPIIIQQPVIVRPMLFSDRPQQVTCPNCRADIFTGVKYESGIATWLIAGGICLLGCWLGCCLVPFCIDGCKDAEHYCIQPTSVPHIGNYFGAIRPWIELQNKQADESNCQPMIISIVDLHAITLPKEPKLLNDYIYKCAASLIACGLDTNKTILYQQSQVPYHGQLAWILGCKATMPQLGRMHQFKFKSDGLAQIPLGVYTYPVLQAADILLFKATHIPVGEDQVQHLEFCRDLALKFNNYYKTDFFPVPNTLEGEFAKIRSLRDPTKKMSKSDADEMSRIDLTDEPNVITKKIRKAVTDSQSLITYEPTSRPGVSTLVEIESACTGVEPDEIVEQCLLNAYDTGEYKKHVANVLVKHLEPIRLKYNKLMADKKYLRQVLDKGASKAQEIAANNYAQILDIIGAR